MTPLVSRLALRSTGCDLSPPLVSTPPYSIRDQISECDRPFPITAENESDVKPDPKAPSIGSMSSKTSARDKISYVDFQRLRHAMVRKVEHTKRFSYKTDIQRSKALSRPSTSSIQLTKHGQAPYKRDIEYASVARL